MNNTTPLSFPLPLPTIVQSRDSPAVLHIQVLNTKSCVIFNQLNIWQILHCTVGTGLLTVINLGGMYLNLPEVTIEE